MQRVLFKLLLLFSNFSLATQDVSLPLVELSQKAVFEIKPVYFESQECFKDSSCSEPIYKGEISIDIKIKPKSRLLSKIAVKLNGKEIPIQVSENLTGHKVYFQELGIAQSPGYLPSELRDTILGLGEPYVYIYGILFADDSCYHKARELEIHYSLETKNVELRDWCVSE